MNDPRVEAAARVALDEFAQANGYTTVQWKDAGEDVRAKWRGIAMNALAAADAVTSGAYNHEDCTEFENALLKESDDTWDGDEAQGLIVEDYVGHLVAEVKRRGGCLRRWCQHQDGEACDHGYLAEPVPPRAEDAVTYERVGWMHKTVSFVNGGWSELHWTRDSPDDWEPVFRQVARAETKTP